MDRFGIRLTCVLMGFLTIGGLHGCNGQVTESSDSLQWRPRVEVASGPAHRGPWRMNRSNWRFVDDPTVDIGPDGSILVGWVNHVTMDVHLQRWTSNLEPSFPKPVNVSTNPDTFSWLPKVRVHPTKPDHVYLLWQEIIFSGGSHGGEILFARSTDGGRHFSEPLNLSQSTAGDGKGQLTPKKWHNGSLDLVIGPQGTIYTTWTEYEGKLWFRRSTDGGKSFSDPIHVTGTDQQPARGPSLAVHGDTVYLAWTVGRTDDANIHLTRLSQGGQQPGPIRVAHDRPGHADAPKIEVTDNGNLHLVYGESPSGVFGQYHVRYAHSRNGITNFGPTKQLSEDSWISGGSHFPSLAVDKEDITVTWHRFSSFQNRPNGLSITRSTNGGRDFSTPVAIPNSSVENGFNGSQQGLLREKLAIHDQTIAVVNSDYIPSRESSIWLWKATTESK